MSEQNKTVMGNISGSNTAENIMKRLMTGKKKDPIDGICERYYNDVARYLTSKLKGFPEHEIMEIAAFCGNRMMVTANDLLFERDREWRDAMEHDKYRKRIARRAAEMNFKESEDMSE